MKLKALTLVGFKSFADKTTFEFPDGVTCVVGPNGCGKSNLVDAIKWVLGEQSAKSLRGGQMLDVVFNGTAQRRSAGYAQVTLTFEDTAGVLSPTAEKASAADQSNEGPRTVRIARRLYRSGESEYLIDKQAVRLKDIREMFMDTGVGAHAYSLIEQGKVETFLQASADDRRAFFDEAAGISKYKARKREALRRLERVEQNLLRLTDIHAEVRKRLRSIKYQAGKARSYREHSAKLNQLRSLFSLAEYHRFSGRRQQLQGGADQLNDALAGVTARIARLEASRTATETEIADLQQKAHSLDGRLAEVSAQSLAAGQRAEMLDARAAELADSVVADTARYDQIAARVEANAAEKAQQQEHQAALADRLKDLQQREEQIANQYHAAREALQSLREKLEDEKNGTIDLLRRTAQLHNEINTHCLRRENLHVQRQRLSGRAEEVARSLEDLLARRAAIENKLNDARALLGDSQAKLDAAGRRLERLGRLDERIAETVARVRQEYAAGQSRQGAVEEMLTRLEGVGEGVRRVLTAARQGRLRRGVDQDRPLIRGMLGEMIETDVARATVIQAALAGAEQRLVADRLGEVLAAAGDLTELIGDSGGVEIVCLDQLPPAPDPAAPPDGEGIIARAADWVRCDQPVAGAVEAALGRTLVVDSLTRALELSQTLGRDWRFVTTAGEVLESDGRVRIRAAQAGAGLVRRKSELAELARSLDQGRCRIDMLEDRQRRVRRQRAHTESVVRALRTAVYEASAERVEHETLLEQINQQAGRMQAEAPLLEQEVRQLAEQITSAVQQEHEAKAKAAELEAIRQQREAHVTQLSAAIGQGQSRIEELTVQRTAAQVALAEAHQQRDALAEGVARVARAGEVLASELEALGRQIEQARSRRQEALTGAAQARSQIQQLAAEKTNLAREAEESAESCRGLQQRLGEIRNQLVTDRKNHDQTAAKLNELRVQLGEAEVRIENLIARTAEDVQLDLVEAYKDYTHDEQRDWESVGSEITELRGKIERLGNVNLDAITEQDELQQREEFLARQIEDIRGSQRQLGELIRRINAESRQRFQECFEAVRGHFNELFRKLFGGGKADVLLIEPENVLESGIEVVARPPGKELRSITLLSGGEKTLTALALMFSFFKARPTPFCLLDEVDAALDEANTDRFVELVREFLTASQFIIISHAKRTISMADQIYGVTMQAPGVSTPVAVRFEDAHKYTEPAAQPATA